MVFAGTSSNPIFKEYWERDLQKASRFPEFPVRRCGQ
jgi:hypothetical protein